MKKIEYGTEFLDQLKDSVHDLYDENKELKKEIERLNNIIKEVREYVDEWKDIARYKLLEMLGKAGVDKE